MMALGFKSAVNDSPIAVMIDSGAALSLADENAVRKMGLEIQQMRVEEGKQKAVKTVSNDLAVPTGLVDLPLQWGQKRITIRCRVFKQISHGIIIGTRDLKRRKALINFDNLMVNMQADDGSEISIPTSVGDSQDKFSWHKDSIAEVMQDECIPAGSQSIISAKVKSISTGESPSANGPIAVYLWKEQTNLAAWAYSLEDQCQYWMI